MQDPLNTTTYDVCVIGGGYMGAAVALGLVRSGARVVMLDRASRRQRASKANFGLVWSQSKGKGNRAYSRLSEQAVRAFPEFAARIEQATGADTELRLGKGLVLCLGDEEKAARQAFVRTLHADAAEYGETHPSQMLDRKEVLALMPGVRLGDTVSGGSFSDIDGDVNPLSLLKAMRALFLRKGGRFIHDCTVNQVARINGDWTADTTRGLFQARKMVMAAGLGNLKLAGFVGQKLPLVPQKGQLLVTQRTRPFLPFPCSGLRQTGCGTVMIGYTNENTGLDVTTSLPETAALARRAVAAFPGLAAVKVVRSWAGLRVLTRDGAPVYDEIDTNLFALATHSCVTLASVHEALLPEWILDRKTPAELQPFSLERFNV